MENKQRIKWNIPYMKELEDFLKPSELCDSDHLLVRETAMNIARKADTPKDAAIEIFYFVRDKILLAFVRPYKAASETLKISKGSCLTKATLQVALLRSIGIPARFRVMEFKGNDPTEWEGILPSLATSKMPERWLHYFAEVYIDDRWVMADATFDKALIPHIEDWDGKTDVYSIEDRAIISDIGSFASIRQEAKKLDEMYTTPVLGIMNSYKFFWILNIYLRLQRLKNKFKPF